MNIRILERLLPSRLPLADYADDIMQAEDFREYISSHGYHFTDKLAEEASRMLANHDGTSHRWSVSEVKAALGDVDANIEYTDGDACYLANQIYSDYVPSAMSEGNVLSATKAMLEDKDGYDGMIYMRWLSDLIGKGDNVDWEEFI